MKNLAPFKIGEDTKPAMEYVKKHCLDPVVFPYFDNNLRCIVKVHQRCGKCDNCQYMLQMQWLERFQAHTYTNDFCYFVTLTYDSNYLVSHLEYAEETNAYRGVDGRPVPLTLSKEHLRNFIKRLHKSTGLKCGDLTYFACGEYGDEHSRPHYHLLIWTKGRELSAYNIRCAWSRNGDLIGMIDFHDLRKNGTFGLTKDQQKEMKKYGIPTTKSRKFTYVCKYIRKYKRFMNLAQEYQLKKKFDSLNPVNGKVSLSYRINVANYDKNDKYEYTYDDFKKAYKPFIVCSTRHAIGAKFFEEKSDEFFGSSSRRVALPNGATVSVSGYFARKIKKQFSPFYSQGKSPDHYTSPHDYQDISKHFQSFLAKFRDKANSAWIDAILDCYQLEKFYDPVLSCWYTLKDKAYYLVTQFDRHLKRFVEVARQSIEDFAQEYIRKAQKYYAKYIAVSNYIASGDDRFYNWLDMSARLSGVTYERAELYLSACRSGYVGAIRKANMEYYAKKKVERLNNFLVL